MCGFIVNDLSQSSLLILVETMLKLRNARTVIGQIRHHTVFSVKQTRDEAFKIAERMQHFFSLELPTPELFGLAVWQFNDRERFRKVKTLQKSMTKDEVLMSDSVTSAFLLAKAQSQEPWAAKEFLSSVPAEKITPSLVTFLLHGYAVADSLGSAERLIQHWLAVYLAAHPSDKETEELHRKLCAGSGSALAATTETSGSKTIDLTATSVGQHTIPLSAWVAMLTVYGKRRAWRQCTDILAYLEHKRDTDAAYKATSSEEVVLANLDEILFPSYLTTTDYIAVNTVAQTHMLNFTMKSKLNRGVNTSNIATLQWSALYHITLRALVETHQYAEVVRVLRRMKETGGGQGPQIPAAIALLGALRGPINPLQDQVAVSTTTSGGSSDSSVVGASKDPVQRCVQLRQQLASALRADVTEAVTALAAPRKEVQRARRWKEQHQATDTTATSSLHVDRAVNTLAREYVQLLCKLDLLEDCKQFISDVQTHVLNVRYSRPHRHSTSATSASADSSESVSKSSTDQEISRIVQVTGFWSDNWMAPYFRRTREHLAWESTDQLYTQLHGTAQFDDSVRRAHLVNARNEVGAWKYKRILKRHRKTGEVRDSDSTTPEVVNYGKKNYLYHDTAAALRGAGKLEELASLMRKHKV